MALVDKIRSISRTTQEAGDPVAILQGIVTKVTPLEVKLEQRLVLSSDLLIVPSVIAERGFEIGDKLIVLRVQGGQQFVILDKVVMAI